MLYDALRICCLPVSDPWNATSKTNLHADLDDLVGARCEQVSSGRLILHVNDVVLAVVEGGCGSSAETHGGERAVALGVRVQK